MTRLVMKRGRAVLDTTTARRVGIGHDIHRLVAGRRLVLGGVSIDAERGFDTPSDGDVLCHSLIDALAGALADGDLGKFFPSDEDPAAQGARSIEYVRAMAAHLAERGLGVEHLDAYVTLGTTRLSPHLESMRGNISEALSVPVYRISVKARTNDGLGPEGEGRAASATTVVLLCGRAGAAREISVRDRAAPVPGSSR
jgi:2-C-methyl-D-erythritol 2,4-cyclodiphosphate synthase